MSNIDMSEMTSKEMLNYYLSKSYSDAREGKERGELVCWSSSIAPNEFCEAMGIHMLYPENHAAAVGAKHGAMDLLEVAEQEGYSLDNCAYARINLAYTKSRECVGESMPLPDFVIVCNNICETLVKWYENLAYELDIPIIFIDVPYNYGMEASDWSLDYIADEFTQTIKQLEEICGRPFDYEKFDQAMDMSLQTCYWWLQAMDMASVKPSPLNGFDIFNYMALIVCMRGQAGARDTFKKLAEELKVKADQGIGGLKGAEEKQRFMWDGIAVWPYLGPCLKTFKSFGMNMTGSTYPIAWNLEYTKGDLRSMARAYTQMYNNMSLEFQIRMKSDVVSHYNCDGVTYHLNRSCKCMGFMFAEIQEEVKKRTGKPYVTFDGDQCDPRNFSEAQFQTRIQSLSEMIDQAESEEVQA